MTDFKKVLTMYLEHSAFNRIDKNNHLFDSIKTHYRSFDDWYISNASSNQRCVVAFEEGSLVGFLSLKLEQYPNSNQEPKRHVGPRLRIASIIGKNKEIYESLLDVALAEFKVSAANEIYHAVFPFTDNWLTLRDRGFYPVGRRYSKDGEEILMAKNRFFAGYGEQQ